MNYFITKLIFYDELCFYGITEEHSTVNTEQISIIVIALACLVITVSMVLMLELPGHVDLLSLVQVAIWALPLTSK